MRLNEIRTIEDKLAIKVFHIIRIIRDDDDDKSRKATFLRHIFNFKNF